MSELSDLLDEIKDDSLAEAKRELLDAIVRGKGSTESLAKETATKLEIWLVELALHEIGQRGFNRAVKEQRERVEQWTNTQRIKARARFQKILLSALDIAVDKIAAKLA